MEIVYPPVVGACKLMFRVLDLRIEVDGAQHIPATGGAVLASNHVSYLDFIFCGLGAQPAGRLVRFMAKKEIFDNRIAGPLMRGMHHISVNRRAGSAAYSEAESALRRGEVIGVFPEATISTSFTVKELKLGAARLAIAAGVPLIPMAVWGPHRLWTKGRPRSLTRRHIPVRISIGAPLQPTPGATAQEVTADLRARLIELVDGVQRNYPDRPAGPDDTWWLPAHLGGSAPLPPHAATGTTGTAGPEAA